MHFHFNSHTQNNNSHGAVFFITKGHNYFIKSNALWYNSAINAQKIESKFTFAKYNNLLGHAFLPLCSLQPNGG
jgi:hypothetical protein